MQKVFGDSYGNDGHDSPMEWTGHGAMIVARPAIFRVSPT
jgi:hypothetical protein